MNQDRNGFFRRFLQSRSSNLLSVFAGVNQGDKQAQAFIRQMLKEGRTEATWDAPLLETRFVVIDTETTGFNPATDVIISVGAIEMTGGQIDFDKIYSSYVRPESDKLIPPVVTKLTGITNEDVKDASLISTVLTELLEFVKDAVVIMHHSRHDVRFLNAALFRMSHSHLTHRIIDTYDVAKWVNPRLNQYSLDDLLATYQIPVIDRHTALGDAKMTAQLWRLLMHEAHEKGVTTVGDLYEQVVLSKL